MIQKIKLKNFQSLKDVTFNLGRVTVLRGSSDVGKSAVIRALNAFFSNSFNQEYAHNGELPFGVAIQKDNKVALGRRTTKGVEYKFDSTVYSKTAKKIPSDISEFLGIYPYSIDVDMSVFFQIQKQFDAPFLLADSSITVAKIIGRVSNLNIVLMAMREMYASQLEAKQELNYLYSRKKELSNSLLKFSNFDSYEDKFKLAESLEDSLETVRSNKQKLLDVISMGDAYSERVKSFEASKTGLANYNDLLNFLFTYENLRQNCFNLFFVEVSLKDNKANLFDKHISFIEDFIAVSTKFSSLKELVSSLENLKTEFKFNPTVFSLLDNIDLENLDRIQEVISQGDLFNTKVRSFRENSTKLKSLEEEFAQLTLEFNSNTVICPYSKLEMQDFCKKNLLS